MDPAEASIYGDFTIALEGLRFFADHGLYEEEKKVGNEFQVDIQLERKAPKKVVHSIDQTINYVEVFQIVQKVFRDRKLLLETCAMEVAEEIEKQIPDLEKLSITIRKVSPPITNFSGSVSVNYSKSYK